MGLQRVGHNLASEQQRYSQVAMSSNTAFVMGNLEGQSSNLECLQGTSGMAGRLPGTLLAGQ